MVLQHLLLLCLVGLGSASRAIPSYIHICKRNDPEVARCIRESVEFLRPRLKVGIPELGVPSLEPLVLPEINVFPGETTSSFRVVLRNVKVHGASDFKITKIKANVPKNIYRVGVKFDQMVFKGDYDVDARIILPFKGAGKFSADIIDIDGQAILRAEIINNKGHSQYNFTSCNLKIKIRDYNLDVDNLFNGDEAVGRAISDLIQDNKAEIIQRALPVIEKKASEILLQTANNITKDIDYDEVFPAK